MRHRLLLAAFFMTVGLGHAVAEDKSADYACADGTKFTIIFLNAPSGDAVVKINGDTIKLAAQPVGSGMWYSSGRHEFRGKGEEATWTVGRRAPTQCQAVAVKETAGPIGHWIMTGIGGKPAAKGVETRMTIVKDGAVSGTGGCNRISTLAHIKGEAITFEPAAATMMMCEDKAMQQEHAFLHALEKTKSWSRDGDTLSLLDASAKPLMQFTHATGK